MYRDCIIGNIFLFYSRYTVTISVNHCMIAYSYVAVKCHCYDVVNLRLFLDRD